MEKKYLLTAPIAGNISFNYFLEENIELKQGQTFCFINPNNTEYYANVLIPQTNFGKVKIGEKVILKIKAYPFQEFGTVEGKLEFIAKIPTDSGYTAKVILPNGLKTNYKKHLNYYNGLTANAEIITDDLKLSNRIFNNLKSIFYKR